MELLRPSVWGNRDGAGASSVGPFTLRTPLDQAGRPSPGPWAAFPLHVFTFRPGLVECLPVLANLMALGVLLLLTVPSVSSPGQGRRWQGTWLPGTCRVDGKVAVLTWDRSVAVRPGGGQGLFAQGP